MTRLSPARQVALDILLDLEESGAYAREGLDASSELRELSRRDAGLATRLVLGVVATYGCLDELIDTYCDRPGSMNERIREALRIATFELLYLKTEPHVVVSQGVELVRSVARSAAGFANAVLRRACDDRDRYLLAEDMSAGRMRRRVSAARRAGLPVWLAEEVIDSLGESQAQALFDAQLEPAPVAIHVNPLDLAAKVEILPLIVKGGAHVPSLPGCVAPVAASDLVASDILHRDGAAVCDFNAQIVAMAATAPGACLEVGAGRGTKSYVMASLAVRLGMSRSGVALELSARKAKLNRRRLTHAGLSDGILFSIGDGCNLDHALERVDLMEGEYRRFESVLVDAPCTGTGTMRRHPEIPWRLLPDDVDRAMPELQLALLRAAAPRVALGGQLIYATCSVLRQENASVTTAFLASDEGAAFKLSPVSEAPAFSQPGCGEAASYVRGIESDRGTFQTTPSLDGFDGHFCARFVRIA